LPGPPEAVASLALEALELLPRRPDWAGGLRAAWTPGEAGAQAAAERFLAAAVGHYGQRRDFPAEAGTSRLSPHLHHGEITPVQLVAMLRAADPVDGRGLDSAWPWVRQLCWREFAHQALFHMQETPDRPVRAEFERFPWADDAAGLVAWQRGRTGYPIVDAGMRELWATGWMHNRVRMIVGSFLTKDLLIPWQEGARWFWDTLIDADLANNTMGWQWVAGCGLDAAPYFRIFNPVSQAKRFDPAGAYVRRWVPELARLPDAWIHEPVAAPDAVLAAAGVALGRTYPRPVVDHGRARLRALAAFRSLRADAAVAEAGHAA
jgi:deoxyribodipyrimidine photo-lyase